MGQVGEDTGKRRRRRRGAAALALAFCFWLAGSRPGCGAVHGGMGRARRRGRQAAAAMRRTRAPCSAQHLQPGRARRVGGGAPGCLRTHTPGPRPGPAATASACRAACRAGPGPEMKRSATALSAAARNDSARPRGLGCAGLRRPAMRRRKERPPPGAACCRDGSAAASAPPGAQQNHPACAGDETQPSRTPAGHSISRPTVCPRACSRLARAGLPPTTTIRITKTAWTDGRRARHTPSSALCLAARERACLAPHYAASAFPSAPACSGPSATRAEPSLALRTGIWMRGRS